MATLQGLHHVTAIAGGAQENYDFYTTVLGMRLVKRSINQDVPDSYHLFYADGEGNPGTDLTFFPWPDLGPLQPGSGLAGELSLAVPPGTLEPWQTRLEGAGVAAAPVEERWGARVLPFRDPHGLALALTESGERQPFAPWAESPVPAAEQIRGLHGVRLTVRSLPPTAAFLTGPLGFDALGAEDGWHRFGVGGGGSEAVVEVRQAPDLRLGRWGVGAIHHVAWRVRDDQAQEAVRQRVQEAGRRPTPVIDRFWFRSVYFKEPGGVLFELATDGPGFSVDETVETLGDRLILPPWYETQRPQIEAALPPLVTGAR